MLPGRRRWQGWCCPAGLSAINAISGVPVARTGRSCNPSVASSTGHPHSRWEKMTSVSRAAQRPARADDPGGTDSEHDGETATPLFDNYLSPERPNAGCLRRDVLRRRQHPVAVPGAARGDRSDRRRRPQGALGGAGPRLRRPGHHVLPLGPGAAVPARHRAPGDQRGRVDEAAARASCSASRRWSCSWPTSTATPRSSATACCRDASSPAASTSTGPRPGSSRRTACASTSPGSTSSATRRACSGCWRTTCATRRACRT